MLIIKIKVIMIMNKQVKFVFVDGDENASNGI